MRRRLNVFDVGPALYKCYTNVLYLLGNVVRQKGAAVCLKRIEIHKQYILDLLGQVIDNVCYTYNYLLLLYYHFYHLFYYIYDNTVVER